MKNPNKDVPFVGKRKRKVTPGTANNKSVKARQRRRLSMPAKKPPPFTTAAAFRQTHKPITWLWKGYLPKGYVSILFGPPGVGKSAFLTALCASITKGDRWPNRKPGPSNPGFVVWVETEGNKPQHDNRFQKLGVPVDRVLYPDNKRDDFWLDDAADIQVLKETMARAKPELVIIDSLSGGLQGGDSGPAAVRALRELGVLASTFDVVVLVVHHTRKLSTAARRRDYELDDLRGASALGQLAKSVIGLDEPDPANNRGRMRVRHLKNNFNKPNLDFGMRFRNGRPVFMADAPVPPGTETMMSKALALLPSLLAKGPVLSTVIRSKCERVGISWDMAKKAKKRLSVVPVRVGQSWYWRMP